MLNYWLRLLNIGCYCEVLVAIVKYWLRLLDIGCRYSVDCRSSNTGLFCGLLVVIAALVSTILFFVFVARDEDLLQVKNAEGH